MEAIAPAEGETVEVVEGVHLTQLGVGEQLSVQHFHIEPGATVPEHSHEHEQAGFVTRGTFTFVLDEEEVIISPGESYVIPGGERHSAENRTDEPVQGVDIFSPPRPDPDWLD